jgi:hypothetical protein
LALRSDPEAEIKAREAFDRKLARHIQVMIRIADDGENHRRASDTLGANMYYGNHWLVPMPRNRAALTINVSKSLIDHKIAIMTKQQPLPVAMPKDGGNSDAAHLIGQVLQDYWRYDGMDTKARDALRLANTTRTCAGKTYWDPDALGGIGRITTDIIPGYKLILDSRVKNPARMEFGGDRDWIPRDKAMMMFPSAAEKINGAAQPSSNAIGLGARDTPINDPFKRNGLNLQTSSSSGGAIINGRSVITAFSDRAAGGTVEDNIEIVEMFYRDRQLVEREIPKRNSFGGIETRIKSEDGKPNFKQSNTWDDILGEYGWELETEEVMEIRMVPKYPYYRHTVLSLPDTIFIDEAWDHPFPYSLLTDQESLEGPIGKGCIIDLKDLQNSVNISASSMLDNLRFSAFRVFTKTSQANMNKNNLVVSPGEIIDVGNAQENFKAMEFPSLSEAWFSWLNSNIALMERLIGATGVMQGESAGRVDSAQGYDMLAEIGGSRIVECTQRYCTWIANICRTVGWYAQRYYTEDHAVRVEDYEGNIGFKRASAPELTGDFDYTVATGSTLAWNESSIRARAIEEFNLGLRDKVSLWQKLGIENWPQIKKRIEMQALQSPQLNPPPPQRTRTNISKPKTGGSQHGKNPHH